MKQAVPSGNESLYKWSWEEGRFGTTEDEYLRAVVAAGRTLRQKDVDNFRRGYAKFMSVMNLEGFTSVDYGKRFESSKQKAIDKPYHDLPDHPFAGQPELEDRWIPCKGVRPLGQWSNRRWTYSSASSALHADNVGENLLGTQMMIIDCDGDHSKDMLDYETIRFCSKWMGMTHCIVKPGKTVRDCGPVPSGYEDIADIPVSFHLTFSTDKVIPHMGFPWAHIDVIGNMRGNLRFWKNKQWNGLDPAPMTDEIWKELGDYQNTRKERARWQLQS